MSVRKRRWWTRTQVQAWAKRLAKEAGHDEDTWPRYQENAEGRLAAMLVEARDLEAAGKADEAAALLKDFPPQEKWIVDYSDRDGKQHIKTFARKKDADAYEATVKVQVKQGTHIAPSKSPTVAEAAEKWINRAVAEGRERTTVRQYKQHADLHIVPRIGKIKLADLTPGRVEAFRDDLVAGMSRALARKVMTSLKSLLKVARHAHVADDVSIGGAKRDQRKLEVGRDIPTPDEVRRLVEAAAGDVRMHAAVRVLAYTGLRASELRGLRWADVDLVKAELHVRQRADRFKMIGSPKSESSRRTVPIGPKLVAVLKEWKIACPPGPEGLVFPSETGAVDGHHGVERRLRPVMRAAKVLGKDGSPKYGPHAFRHFFASWCINRKADGGRELPAKVVQALLGHGSIVMTLDRYGHLFPRGDDREELAAAEARLG